MTPDPDGLGDGQVRLLYELLKDRFDKLDEKFDSHVGQDGVHAEIGKDIAHLQTSVDAHSKLIWGVAIAVVSTVVGLVLTAIFRL